MYVDQSGLDSQTSTCLCIPSDGIESVYHYVCLYPDFYGTVDLAFQLSWTLKSPSAKQYIGNTVGLGA